MSTNCLVKTLKGDTGNNNLPLDGYFKFKVNSGDSLIGFSNMNLFTDGVNASEGKVTGGVEIYDNAGTTRLDSNGKFTIPTASTNIKVKGGANGGYMYLPKYDIRELNFNSAALLVENDTLRDIMSWYDGSLVNINISGLRGGDFSVFEGVSTIRGFFCIGSGTEQDKYIVGDFDFLAASKNEMRYFGVQSSAISGKLRSIAGPNMSQCNTYNNQKVEGDIADLGACTYLSMIQISDCLNISGDVEDFVRGQVTASSNPRASATNITFSAFNSGVKFKGASLTGSNGKLSWSTSGSTVTITYTSSTGTVTGTITI